MYQSPIDSDHDRDDSFFSQPSIVLLDQEHGLYVKRRYHLTARELQIARLVCRGLNNNQLATTLKIRQGTVKTHLRNIYRRVRVKTKITLLLRFVEDVNGFYGLAKPHKPRIPIVETKHGTQAIPKTSEKS